MTYIIIGVTVAVILIVLLVAICLIVKAAKSVPNENEEEQAKEVDEEGGHPVGNRVSPSAAEKG